VREAEINFHTRVVTKIKSVVEDLVQCVDIKRRGVKITRLDCFAALLE